MFAAAFLVLLTPLNVYALQQTAVLQENGVKLEVLLPDGVDSVEQRNTARTVLLIGDVSVSLEILDKTVEGQTKHVHQVHQSMLGDYPDTTFIEEYPPVATDGEPFQVHKMLYNNHNNVPTTHLQAYCKLNYRYTYYISLRGEGDISTEMLASFFSYTATATPVKFEPILIGIAIASCSLGLFFIGNEARKKHFWPKTTGTITGYTPHRRSGTVSVAYLLPNGAEVTGKHTISAPSTLLGALPINKQVIISYSRRKPHNIHLITSKSGYFWGVVFLVLAAFYIYLLVFQL